MRVQRMVAVACAGSSAPSRWGTVKKVVLALAGAYLVFLRICVKKGRPATEHLPEILRPFRSFLFAAVNGYGKLMGQEPAKVPSEEALIEEAKKTCGLPTGSCEFDFPGDESKWQGGFEVLVKSLNTEARLNLAGAMIAKGWLIRFLQVRLRMIHAWKQLPRGVFETTKIEKPIFILGLPRTGSTFLHNLIKQTQGVRVPLNWEMFDMIPAGKDTFDQHHAKCKKMLDDFKQFTPGIEHIHNNEWDMADECVNFMSFEFDGLTPTCIFNVPEFLKRITERQPKDRDHVMRFHRRSVQFLQHRDAAQTQQQWVFKAPFWSFMIEEIEKWYPDALFVFTHRAPHKCMGSISSLCAKWWGASTDEIDLKQCGKEQVWMHEEMTKRFMSARRRWKNEPQMAKRVFDVHLEELMENPIDAVGNMFDHFGLEPLSKQSRDQMQKWRETDQVHAGKHPVTLEDFGLSKDGLLANPIFADYCKEFQVNTK